MRNQKSSLESLYINILSYLLFIKLLLFLLLFLHFSVIHIQGVTGKTPTEQTTLFLIKNRVEKS